MCPCDKYVAMWLQASLRMSFPFFFLLIRYMFSGFLVGWLTLWVFFLKKIFKKSSISFIIKNIYKNLWLRQKGKYLYMELFLMNYNSVWIFFPRSSLSCPFYLILKKKVLSDEKLFRNKYYNLNWCLYLIFLILFLSLHISPCLEHRTLKNKFLIFFIFSPLGAVWWLRNLHTI